MGLPITASRDTAWTQTRVSVVTPLALRYSALDRSATRVAGDDQLGHPTCTFMLLQFVLIPKRHLVVSQQLLTG